MKDRTDKFIDLTHSMTTDMPIFPGYPQPVIEPFLSHAQTRESGRYEGCSCQIDRVSFVSSTGTYMDAPAHFFEGGRDIAAYSPDELVMEPVVLDCRAGARAGEPLDIMSLLEGDSAPALEDKALLLETGWSDFWGSPEYFNHPFLNSETVDIIISRKPRLVGIDALVIDDRRDKKRPAHTGFLGNGILIVENLTNLDRIRNRAVEVFFIPLKIAGAGSLPVRAFSRVI